MGSPSIIEKPSHKISLQMAIISRIPFQITPNRHKFRRLHQPLSYPPDRSRRPPSTLGRVPPVNFHRARKSVRGRSRIKLRTLPVLPGSRRSSENAGTAGGAERIRAMQRVMEGIRSNQLIPASFPKNQSFWSRTTRTMAMRTTMAEMRRRRWRGIFRLKKIASPLAVGFPAA